MKKPNLKTNVSARRNRFGWYALGIFAFALAVRLLHIWHIYTAPFSELLMGDAQSYNAWAQQIAGGDWLGNEVFYQAPLYPYFMGVIYAIFNGDLLTVRVCQAILGALSCVLLANAGRRLFSKPVGIVTGLMLALYAPAIFFDGLIQKSALDLFFLCLVLWLLSEIVVEPRKSLWWWAGLAMGALTLTRENALVFVIAIFIWLFLYHRGMGRQRLVFAVMFLLGLAAMLLPVAIRNQIIGGEFHLTTSQFGPNFYIGNNEHANGIYTPLRAGRGIPAYERLDATELAEQAVGKKLTPSEVSQYWTGLALDYITSQPGDWLRLKALTFALVWKAIEIADTEDQYTHADQSIPLRLTGYVCHFGVIVPLALFGVLVTWHKRDKLWLLYLMSAIYVASVVMFFVLARFRYPLVPFLMLFASAGLVEMRGFLRRGSTLQIAGCIAATMAAAIFCNWPTISKDSQRAVTYNNMGIEFSLQGKVDKAIKHYRQALKFNPDSSPAHYNLGKEFALQGRFDEATRYYRKALQLNPGEPSAYCYLGEVLSAQGKLNEAIAHFTKALQIRPNYANAHNGLCIAFYLCNKIDKAIEHGGEAVRIKPDYANAHYNLGAALFRKGKVNDAIKYWSETVRLEPSNYKAHSSLATALYQSGGSKVDQAIEHWTEAIRLNPDDAIAHRNLKSALVGQGKHKKAIEAGQEK